MDAAARKNVLLASVVACAGATAVAACLLNNRRRRHRRLCQQSEEVERTLATFRALRSLRQNADFVDDFLAQVNIEGLVFHCHGASSGTFSAARPGVKMTNHVGPVALVPAPFPADMYEKAVSITADAQCRLIDAVARDLAWLKKTFGPVASVDDFAGRCLGILSRTSATAENKIRCHIIRNDFMFDCNHGSLRLLDSNTLSGTNSGSAGHLAAIQRRLLAKHLPRVASLPETACRDEVFDVILPRNDPSDGVAEAIAEAHRLYCRRYHRKGRLQPVVLFVVVTEDYNEADHRHVERALSARGVQTIRRTMQQLVTSSWRTPAAEGPSRLMFECGCSGQSLVLEASVCYFRWMWSADPEGWTWREEVARTVCVEIPSIGACLAGQRLCQAACASPHRLDELRGLTEADKAQLRSCYPEQFLMCDPDRRKAARNAFQQSRGPAVDSPLYIAKPGLQGQANQIADPGIIQDIFEEAASGRRQALSWVLVERVVPPVHACLVINRGESTLSKDTPAVQLVELRPSVCELGVYAVALADGQRGQLRRRAVGHVARSICADGNEGGSWSKTSAVLDSPFLCRGDWVNRDSWTFGFVPRPRS